MTSQIRVDEITNRSGLGTVTIYDNGFEFTGVTTFTEDVDITGGLTIGGVLTYEDVTNIDSVGVVTARAGIRVTGDSIHVESSEDRLLYLKSTDANAYLTFEDTDSSSAFANRVGTVSDGLYFSTGGGGERLRITSDGKLMTQSAGYIYTTSSAGSLSLYGGNTNLGGGIVLSGGNTNGDIRFYAQMSTATPAERLRITSGGIVLINDVTVSSNRADAPLQIETGGSGNALNLRARSSDNIYSYLNFQNNAGSQTAAHIYLERNASNNAGTLVFGTAASNANTPTERLRITSGGNVSVNHDSPNTRLYVRDSGASISSAGNAILNSTQKGIRLVNSNNNNTSLGLWFTTGDSHHAGISGQRTNSASHWGTDLRFYTHEGATNDLTYTRERLRISCNGLLTNRKGNNAANTGGNILGRYKYTQVNQGSGYGHLILGADGRKLQDYITTNCYCIITVCVIGTGSNNMFCQYYYHSINNGSSSNLTHMYGNNGSSSNRPYMQLVNTSDPVWKMSHNGSYTLDIEVAIYGGAEGHTFTTEFGNFTTNP